jgi:hypothetical protein
LSRFLNISCFLFIHLTATYHIPTSLESVFILLSLLELKLQMSDTEVAKVQLREHLATLLVPRLAEGFWSINDNAAQLCERNKQTDQVIRTFQNMLTKIPEWSDSTLSEEVERILKVSNCGYMDDLLMGVFLSYMKSFAALQYRGVSSQVKVEFERPNVTKFIHELYKFSARKLWQSAYLFKTHGVPTEQQAKNRQEVEQTIYRTLDDVVRSFLPWEVIAKSYFVEPPPEDKPAPAPASKSVIFEDVPLDESESEEEEEERPRTLQFVEKPADEDDKLSVTDLDEKQEEEVAVVIPEVDPLAEIDANVGDESLVLNL